MCLWSSPDLPVSVPRVVRSDGWSQSSTFTKSTFRKLGGRGGEGKCEVGLNVGVSRLGDVEVYPSQIVPVLDPSGIVKEIGRLLSEGDGVGGGVRVGSVKWTFHHS